MRYLILVLAFLFGIATSDSPTIEQLVEQEDYQAAFALASGQASQGDLEAYAWLGQFYEAGTGVEKDLAKAASNYRIGASGGANHARWRLGVMIDQGSTEGTLEEAVALFRAAAAEDYSSAVVSLAVMQALGRGTPEDDAAALTTYRRAAGLGSLSGVLGFGMMTANGEGITADKDEGTAWVLLAASLGHERAEGFLEELVEGWSSERLEKANQRAEQIRLELLNALQS